MKKIFSNIIQEIILVFQSPVILFKPQPVLNSGSLPGVPLKKGKILRGLKKTVEITFSAVTFILIPLIAFTLITSRTSSLFGLQSFTVLTGSMSPGIPTGSIIYTGRPENVFVGDVITFKSKGVNVTHRVAEIVNKDGEKTSPLLSPLPGALSKEIFYKTRGDANKIEDSDLVSSDKVIGKVFFSLPAIGKYISYLKTIQGFLIFIIGPALIFIAMELWNIKKEVERQTEKRVLERMRPSSL